MFEFWNKALYDMLAVINMNVQMANNRKNINHNRVAQNRAVSQNRVGAAPNSRVLNKVGASAAVTNAATRVANATANATANTNSKVTKKKVKEFVSKATVLLPTTSHILIPSKKEDVKIGSVVFFKIKGKYIPHKIAAIDAKKGYKLTRKGHSNGWSKNIFTKVLNNGEAHKVSMTSMTSITE